MGRGVDTGFGQPRGFVKTFVRFFSLSVTNGQCIIPDMKPLDIEDFEKYLTHLRALPFVRKVEIRAVQPAKGPYRPDAVLRLRTPRRKHDLWVEVKRTHLTYVLVDGILARIGKMAERPWILFAPYVGQRMGRHLAEFGLNYVDAAGNCRLRIGDDYFATIEGQRPARDGTRGRGIGVPGYQVLFAILAKPDFLNTPIRTLADAAGVGKTAAGDTIARLGQEGLIAGRRRRRHLLNTQTILDRWLAGYATTVRPRLLVGRYRTEDTDPVTLENRIERALGDRVTWAWGGGAAAMRLTKHYRGEETVLHVEAPPADLAKRLRALPAEDGPLTILRAPGKIGFEGILPKTVHPLLVFTELLVTGKERAREAAQEIRERYLELKV